MINSYTRMDFQPISWEIIAGASIVVIALSSTYIYKKKFRKDFLETLYLESADFKSLPEAGPDSCFMGKIAKTKFAAFLEPNQLLSHTLIGGSANSGKTIAAQVLAEEALRSNIPVLVFDPTLKWTGFVKENRDLNMLNLYPLFDMKKDSVQSFNGNIYTIEDPMWKIDLEKHCHPGEISVFSLHKLNTEQMNTFIENNIQNIFQSNLCESTKIRFLLVFEEVHRLIHPSGVEGEGLIQIGRAMREFRRWGIGIISVSPVLTALSEVIRANINTEIQMKTSEDEDLKAVELRYGKLISQGVAESPSGIGLIQNARYNRGEPYFVNFRPTLHDFNKLENQEIERYASYNSQIEGLDEGLSVFKKQNIDIFDMELELDLIRSNVRKRNFVILTTYFDSLKSKIGGYEDKIKKDQISEEERAILSRWESEKEKELKSYEDELSKLLEEKTEELSKKEKLIIKRKKEEMEKIKHKRERVEEEERAIMYKLRNAGEELEHKSQVLNLLKKYQQQVRILNNEVMKKETKKVKTNQEKIKNRKIKQIDRLMVEREKIFRDEREELGDIEYEKALLEEEIENTQKKLSAIHRDKELILEKDRQIREKEKELVEKIKERIQNEIKTKKEFRDKEPTKEKKPEESQRKEKELNQKLKSRIDEREKLSREKRKELVNERDSLHNNLQKMKKIWGDIISKEKEIGETQEKLRWAEKEKTQETASPTSNNKNMFKEKLDQLKNVKERLEYQLEEIRQEVEIEEESRE